MTTEHVPANKSELTLAPAPVGLAVDRLRWSCSAEELPFETTAEVEPTEEIIGQDRARQAIQLGLEMKSPGYNIFLAGFVGTGRTTTVQRMLQKLDRETEAPDDLCYVHNFESPDRPQALFVPAGKARRLCTRMRLLVRHLHNEIPKVFEGDGYREQRDGIRSRFEERQKGVVKKFEERVSAEGFALVSVQAGPIPTPDVVPTIDGEPKFLPELEEAVKAGTLEQEKLDRILEKRAEFVSELPKVLEEAMGFEGEMQTELETLNRDTVRPVVVGRLAGLRKDFAEQANVLAYLDRVREFAFENLERFVATPAPAPAEGLSGGTAALPELVELAVNVVVDNGATAGAPVIVEDVPTAAQLFGVLERAWSPDGREHVNHMKIRAGSVHAASGGYLILHASDLFNEEIDVWNTLKRVLRTGKLEIPADHGSMLGPPSLKPEPVDVKVKVVMIGDLHTYTALHHYEEDFRKIFKIRADFDTEIENESESILKYAAFAQRLAVEEKTLPFDRTAIAAMSEYGVRLSGRRSKLSTRFNLIADLVREASHFASRDRMSVVRREHVGAALKAKEYRGNLPQKKMQDLIDEGSIFIDVEGTRVGAVNGLAVYETGDHAFGLPSRITASVSMGNAGIINIEREADLSGRTHDKGVQILAGYLRERFAQDKPMTLSASICFEQSYSGVDGDSASSTEIYALLSSLADIPIRQDLSVTGSVNQKGEIQPIGGVNEKIEGFFDICAARGLTGTQGVLIPSANVNDLMLERRVVEAVAAGRFHIYAIAKIDQGIEVLTGVAAGERVGRRRFAANTVNGRADLRLRKLAKQMRDYGGHA